MTSTESRHDGFHTGVGARQEANQSEYNDDNIFGDHPFARSGPKRDQLQKRWENQSQEWTAECTDQRDEEIQLGNDGSQHD